MVKATGSTARPVSWRINGERLVILGWTSAILQQIGHPLIAAGVHEHSGFRESPLAAVRRLRHTTQAMLAITFGSTEAQQRALAGIRAIHDRVHGVLPLAAGPYPAGTSYSAHDPALLLWVHATLLDATVAAYERFVGPLSAEERHAYCDESAFAPIALGARPAEVPRDWSALETYLTRMTGSGQLTVSSQAREIARALLSDSVPWPLQPAGAVNRLLTAGLLPDAWRDAYGLPWSIARQRRFDLLCATLRGTQAVAPAILTRWAAARER